MVWSAFITTDAVAKHRKLTNKPTHLFDNIISQSCRFIWYFSLFSLQCTGDISLPFQIFTLCFD